MSQATIESLIAYALIPAYVFGLLILVAIIARSQLGLFTSHNEQQDGHKTFSLREYGIVLGLFLLFIIMTLLTRKKDL
jgi:cytochrome c biogenesis factor